MAQADWRSIGWGSVDSTLVYSAHSEPRLFFSADFVFPKHHRHGQEVAARAASHCHGFGRCMSRIYGLLPTSTEI